MEIKISQFCAMMMMIMFSCFLGIIDASSFNIVGVDSWLIPIFGFILGLPILLLFLYIYTYKSNYNLNELIIYLFGKKIGSILSSIITLFALSFIMVTFWNLTNFVASQYLYNTPGWFVDLIFILTTYYFFSKSENTIFRSSLILIYIVIILFLISFIGLLDKIDINNIKPILEHGPRPVFNGIYNYIAYTTLPIFTLSIVPKKRINTKYFTRWIIGTYITSNVLIFIMLFLLVSVFGIELVSLYQYPTYHILKRVFVGGFIERLENVLSIPYIIVLFIPCAFSSYYSIQSIKDIYKIKKKYIYPIIVIIMFLSSYIFRNNTIGEQFLIHIYPIFMGVIIIGIPFLIAIKITVKKIKKIDFHLF